MVKHLGSIPFLKVYILKLFIMIRTLCEHLHAHKAVPYLSHSCLCFIHEFLKNKLLILHKKIKYAYKYAVFQQLLEILRNKVI